MADDRMAYAGASASPLDGQERLAALRRRAGAEVSIADLAAEACRVVIAGFDLESAYVLKRTPDGTAEVLAGAGAGIDLSGSAPATGPLDDAWHAGAGVLDELPEPWRARGACFAIGAPIGRGEPHAGWLVGLASHERAFSDDRLHLLDSAAHVLTMSDELANAAHRARHAAVHDELTGLPNRTLLTDRVNHAIRRAVRHEHALAVLCLEIDRFAHISDTLGYAVGDELLRTVARRLAGIVRDSDTVARTGSNEFAIVCELQGGERVAIELAQRVSAALAAPVVVDERELHVNTSIGVVFSDGRDALADTLMRDASVAMGRVKGKRGGGYELFDRPMRRRILERLDLEQAMRNGLGREEFVLHYQPIVSLTERRILGVEALVRWEHPERGLVAPGAFIPVAEESGLIVDLGRWVLTEACRQLARWMTDPALAEIYMSVNLSGRQLAAPGLPEEIAATIRRAGIAPAQLSLELTESVLMEETGSPTAVLQRLQDLGTRLMLDDFGTGYSSLNYVKRFPLHVIKVDRSFVAGIPEDENDRHILRAIINMATALDVAVIAEGVETLEHATWLASMGCDAAQGFGLARPAPAAAIEPLLRDGLPSERLRWSLELERGAGAAEPQGRRLPLELLSEQASERTLPLSEAAQALGISLSTMRRWADTDRIEAVRTPGGHRRFPISEVQRIVAETAQHTHARLRAVPLPDAQLPALADALESAPTVTAAASSLYEPQHAGWFATTAGAAPLSEWARAVAAACRTADYEPALAATSRLGRQADQAAVGALERHLVVERIGELTLRRLRSQDTPPDTLVAAHRLFTRLRHTILA